MGGQPYEKSAPRARIFFALFALFPLFACLPRFSLLDTPGFHRRVRHSTRRIFAEPVAAKSPAFSYTFPRFQAPAKFTNRTISGHF
ncbi:hypothetical protein [Paraburkholderia caffeinilytica]|uniref:hypothetical protein n=1 Tax=Paraburkholderia caffeinilytica TaxID=1761016 RepID=UPI0013BE9407|nr:hypothetical protein [Paraburkholderia caffeinilytica]